MSELMSEVIRSSFHTDGVLLSAMHAAQKQLGYLSDDAIDALADTFGLSVAEVVSAATFYGMIRLEPPAPVCIQICKSAPCHIAGAQDVISEFEAELGIKMGERTPDGMYALEYVECLGQCQASPAILIGGKLYTGVTPGQVKALLREGVEKT